MATWRGLEPLLPARASLVLLDEQVNRYCAWSQEPTLVMALGVMSYSYETTPGTRGKQYVYQTRYVHVITTQF
jgi:hypothetical protein